MAAARNGSKSTKSGRDSSRLSFAKITDTLKVPDLLDLQTESFAWLVGNEEWQQRVAQAEKEGRQDLPSRTGLEEIFEEISPIENLDETMQLSFTNPYLEEEKYTLDQCKERGKTYAAPLYVEAEFMNHNTGEIKTQTVFMGDFPLMTEKGTFVINGTERVVVSQLVRSPGVYFERVSDKTSDKDIFSARMIPSRGAWLEFEIDKRDQVGVRIDRKRKQSVTVFLKALGLTAEDIRKEFAGFESIELTLEKDNILTKEEALKDIYRKLRPGEQVAAEAARDQNRPPRPTAPGRAMASDHRRILATGLGRLRSKLKYRPVLFDLMPAAFTLSELQTAAEAVAGLSLHKQNFRRGVERTGLVQPTGRLSAATGGRPAELFRVIDGDLSTGETLGLPLPAQR